jgi:rhamnose utilization protein RhaD (predicted bifunctional aldolase and dehydrogenase)/NAD(P)-dependent dehydrogenase (short-subunit alcohol dehydrogenase family)
MRIEPLKSLWNARDARAAAESATPKELGLRVYGSRLLGADPALVYAGGGNTSAKGTTIDLYGDPVETLFVKGSGSDLATATARDFTALPLEPTRRLLDVAALSDRDMMRELQCLRLDPEAPPPSVEALLHALLPHRFVDHAHPVALLALLDSKRGGELARELYADDCLIVPYVKPGFDLALLVRRCWQEASASGRDLLAIRGMVLEKHGLFAFDDEARTSYETLVELVGRAERALPRRPRATLRSAARRRPAFTPLEIARLRQAVSKAAGRPMTMTLRDDLEALSFLDRRDLAQVSQRGTLTPDHVIRTKRLPMIVRTPAAIEAAVEKFTAAYRVEFERLRAGRALARLDPAPRVVLVPGTGLFGVGKTPKEAEIAAEIAAQTAWAIERAQALGGYRPLRPKELFEVEYWELEQAKLARAGPPKPLAGRVALVTGAASGIGRAASAALLAQGAPVVGLDLSPFEAKDHALGGGSAQELIALRGDATDRRVLRRALELAVARFGGLDIVVANAGIFFAGPTIAATADADWRRTMAIDLDAQFALLAESGPLLELSPAGGAVVVVGSKNVAAPGPGAAAYSAAKAAVTQLARVAALELGPKGVRVNVVHPDAVFDTGVWAGGMLEARAAKYGLSVAEYRKRNVLKREVTAADVGAVIAALCGELFAKTTGAQIPIDGGNERVI